MVRCVFRLLFTKLNGSREGFVTGNIWSKCDEKMQNKSLKLTWAADGAEAHFTPGLWKLCCFNELQSQSLICVANCVSITTHKMPVTAVKRRHFVGLLMLADKVVLAAMKRSWIRVVDSSVKLWMFFCLHQINSAVIITVRQLKTSLKDRLIF